MSRLIGLPVVSYGTTLPNGLTPQQVACLNGLHVMESQKILQLYIHDEFVPTVIGNICTYCRSLYVDPV